jgi:hypothetical protein
LKNFIIVALLFFGMTSNAISQVENKSTPNVVSQVITENTSYIEKQNEQLKKRLGVENTKQSSK